MFYSNAAYTFVMCYIKISYLLTYFLNPQCKIMAAPLMTTSRKK